MLTSFLTTVNCELTQSVSPVLLFFQFLSLQAFLRSALCRYCQLTMTGDVFLPNTFFYFLFLLTTCSCQFWCFFSARHCCATLLIITEATNRRLIGDRWPLLTFSASTQACRPPINSSVQQAPHFFFSHCHLSLLLTNASSPAVIPVLSS